MTDSFHEDWRRKAITVEQAVSSKIVGQSAIVRLINIAIFARGHVLLEGDVGVGKTTILRAFSTVVSGKFERIEGTVDLMPTDLIYHTYVDKDGQPRIDPGPLLRHGSQLSTFFFNEINRARPQVQSLLLRAMAERTVSAFNRKFEFPHMTVFADRNKIEKEETFELASAAKDRFMLELNMSKPENHDIRRELVFNSEYHDVDKLIASLDAGICAGDQLNEVAVAIQEFVRSSPALEKYVMQLWEATENPQKYGIKLDNVDMDKLILAGASPRGMSALLRAARIAAWIDGRDFLSPEDLHSVLPAALAHRVFFTPVYELRRAEIAPALIKQIMNQIASP